MFSRTALRKVFVQPWTQAATHTGTRATTILPANSAPIFSQSQRAYLTTESNSANGSSPNPESTLSATPRVQSTQPREQIQPATPTKEPAAPTFSTPLKVSRSVLSQLPNLISQKPHYITAHLHDKPYLLTVGDQLRLPFLMPKVKSGDVIRLNRASVLGSREFTMKGAPYVDERLFECRVRVLGVDAEPMRIKEKTKRRRRHVQKVRSKHRYTLLRVMDVNIKSAEELLAEGAVVDESA